MKPGALILGVAVSVVLLAAAGILYMMANDGGEQHYRRSINTVQQIQRLSSDWSIEVTRVRADPFADFDSLAAFIPRMARFKEALADAARRIPDLPDRLANAVNAYISAIDAKEERVERFKTGYAVVRNSTRYLPIAAANVARLARESEDPTVDRSVAGLIQEVDLYLAAPSEAARVRLLSEIEKLREASVGYPPALANTLANLFSHAEVLVTKQAPTEELYREATSDRISGLTDELIGNLRFELGRKEVRLAYYDHAMLAVVALLALFWIVLAVHQRRRGEAVAAPVAAGDSILPAAAASPLPAAPGGAPSALAAAAPIPVPAPAPPAPAAAAAAVEAAALERDLEEATMKGFVVKCAAGTLATSADQITDRMDYLRQTRHHLQNALENSDSVLDLHEGTDIDEEMAALTAIAGSVRQEASGIADLARRLEAVSAMPCDEVTRCMTDINACVDEAVEACGADSAGAVTRRLGDIPEILASKTEFRLLLREIIENAVLAVQELEARKGIVRIETARKDDDILITIIDNGNGIAAERRMHIFKPFYTSREGAMGIGLSLAGHLVKKYEGVIKINSLPGQGTMARITLPTGVPSS